VNDLEVARAEAEAERLACLTRQRAAAEALRDLTQTVRGLADELHALAARVETIRRAGG
jgi:hypothetical protein